MKDLNLIPKSLIVDKKNKAKKTYLSILIICIGLIAVTAYTAPAIYEINLRNDKQQLEKQVNSTASYVETLNEFNSLKKAVEEREAEGKKLSLNRIDVLGIVSAIENSCPEKLFIQNFVSTGNNDSDTKIVLKGVSTDENTLASFLRNLMDDDYFNNVVLSNISNKQGNNGTTFEVTLNGIKKSDLIIYNNWNNGFRICYEPDWSKKVDKDDSVLFTANKRLTSTDADSLEITVTSTELTSKEFTDKRMNKLKYELEGFKKIYTTKTKSSGEEAYKLMYLGDEKGTRYKYSELLIVKDSKGYIVKYKSDPNSFEVKERTIDRILKSFTAIKSP
ncbi:PilN domain-containing protein [Ruminiclostridium cellulolyticum]|uniref:Fimbrial assembly family protein n=1 Tax=Ruminiclostridium cellulolyticum (strain ATCC 35319 / DSM 5812 / JCM 6584 / H10) TaxID=394503 RepID=B8I5K1_RUMCH|nr:PilN domain-containing protein [Ruminiclostridium cellulolyticum]ACL76737.1 Fimbrial assembly family protein [Ruminiclostridium cellulolyticum H10]